MTTPYRDPSPGEPPPPDPVHRDTASDAATAMIASSVVAGVATFCALFAAYWTAVGSVGARAVLVGLLAILAAMTVPFAWGARTLLRWRRENR